MERITTQGFDKNLQDLISKSSQLLLADLNFEVVTDEKRKHDFFLRIADRELFNNGVRVYPLNIFYNQTLDYFLCQLAIDCSGFHTLREGYRDRGIFSEFCGFKPETRAEGTLSITPKTEQMADDFRSKVASLFGLSNFIQTGNHLVDSRYEIESSSEDFAGKILSENLVRSLSKSKSLSVFIKDKYIFCSTGINTAPQDLVLLKAILEAI